MTSLNDGISIVLGLLLVILAGFLNGSWNVSFRPTHGYAVARQLPADNDNDNKVVTSTTTDLAYHQAFILFQVYAVLANIPICLYWAGGPAVVADILQASSATDIILVCLFSALWGVGTFGFAVACQIAGVGLGTNLCMGVIMVLGAFLPLCLEGAITTAAGGVVVAGLAVCSVGLALAVKSLQQRDVDEQEQRRNCNTLPATASATTSTIQSAIQTVVDDNDAYERTRTNGPDTTTDNTTATDEKPTDASDGQTLEDDYSTTYKVLVCVVAGVFASQLQFAFVFGQDMIDLAKELEDDVPSSGTSAIIWLFALTLGAPASIAYGIYNNPSDQAWSRLCTCSWYRHVLIALTTSIPWVSHILAFPPLFYPTHWPPVWLGPFS